jgi:CheY-like chemotaxis protein
VITNLIFNALDAMPKGGKITIKSGMDGDNVFFSVKDTGEGMNEDVQNRIFDPFFTTKGAGNSGLGMSVSYGIISRHEGEILLESKVGQGTVFTIKLPLRGEEDVDVPQETVVEVKETANVLIIDDERGILDALSDMLTAMGHRVSTADNGLEGLEKFMKTGHDVVFTDLGMPGISGWEVAKSIKEARPNTPVVMLTGWQLGLSEDKMKAQNVDLVITKPFEINKLHKVMAEALELKSRM